MLNRRSCRPWISRSFLARCSLARKRWPGGHRTPMPHTLRGIGRNDQKSALNAFKKRASCTSRAVSPSQRHFRVTHNPWVVGSSPTRPTSALVLVHYGVQPRSTRRRYSSAEVLKAAVGPSEPNFLIPGADLNGARGRSPWRLAAAPRLGRTRAQGRPALVRGFRWRDHRGARRSAAFATDSRTQAGNCLPFMVARPVAGVRVC